MADILRLSRIGDAQFQCHWSVLGGRKRQPSLFCRPLKQFIVRADAIDGTDTSRSIADSAPSLPPSSKASQPVVRKNKRKEWGLRSPLLGDIPKEPWHRSNVARFAGITTALAAAAQVGSSIIDSIEAVPVLPQAEILLGTLVVFKFAYDYLEGGAGRARMESAWEGLVDRVQGRHYADMDQTEADNFGGPSMLDVQLRALVDRHVDREPQRGSKSDSEESTTVTASGVDRTEGLIESFKDFVTNRDMEFRRSNAFLRSENQALGSERARRKELEKVVAAKLEELRKEKEASSLLGNENAALKIENESMSTQLASLSARLDAVAKELQSSVTNTAEVQRMNAQLMAQLKLAEADKAEEHTRLAAINTLLRNEKEEVLSRVAALSTRVESLAEQQASMRSQNESLRQANEVLSFEAEQKEHEVLRLREQLLAVENGAAVTLLTKEASEVRRIESRLMEQMLAAEEQERAAKDEEDLTQHLRAAMESLEAERLKAVQMAQELEGQLADAVNVMEERELHISWVSSSLAESQRRAAQNERFVEELRSELDAIQQPSEVQASNAELEAVLEAERKRHAETAGQLQRQLEAVHSEKQAAAERIAELEEELAQSGLRVTATQASADEVQTALQWAEVAESASPSRSQSMSRSMGNSPSRSSSLSRRSLSFRKSEETIRRSVSEARAETAAPSTLEKEASLEIVLPSPSGRRFSRPQQSSPLSTPKEATSEEEGLRSPSPRGHKKERSEEEKKLMTFARKRLDQFVDRSRPLKEQPEEFNKFVEALVGEGAEDGWARDQVTKTMNNAHDYYKRKNKKKQQQEDQLD
eukprot:TRINITY_DN10391_c0_g1_i1.p1 TRINITY_DN10391_c0_g1~~TRINITY_DN10391_c0_g1_i1.p1  ORF type:complete len:819 (-),score=230.55 TRINITY_DN10391_c0_g1_i1:504-2960(-)